MNFLLYRKRFLTAAVAAVIFTVCSAAGAQQNRSACIACHEFMGGELEQPVSQWNISVHKQNGITCDLCHGGNAGLDVGDLKRLSAQQLADKQAQAMSKAHGFVGRPSGSALFAMCGRCHGDSVDRYAGSIMGKAYLDGKGGPSCVTCHSAHNNIIPQVPKVCESCHKDTAGFESIDPMNVTGATVNELSRIRVRLAEGKAKGAKPGLVPGFPEEMDPYQIGILAFCAVFVVFIFGYLIYITLEKRK